MITTVIMKPTKACNADCSYCSAPPSDDSVWDEKKIEQIFKSLKGKLSEKANIIWHGGEPMKMGPDFFYQAKEISQFYGMNELEFGIQTNLLLYKSKRWEKCFSEIFEGRIGTSFDPEEECRTIDGNAKRYTEHFFKKLDEVLLDGFYPALIGTYTEDTAPLADKMYEMALSNNKKGNPFGLRFNYRYPAGRASSNGALITPETYGNLLLNIFERWIKDAPGFHIIPLTHMIEQVTAKSEAGRCPWTRQCTGKFLSIEPNGDLYNCADFADLKDTKYRFGNIFSGQMVSQDNINIETIVPVESIIDTAMSSHVARKLKRRITNLPYECSTCEHFAACEGGCMRDVVLYEKDINGKFYYCDSWKAVFSRIKEAIKNREMDSILQYMNIDPVTASERIGK